GPDPGSADRQADQCRISKRGFDAAREHHDAGAHDGIGLASACTLRGCYAYAFTAAGGIAGRGGRQETAAATATKACPDAGAAASASSCHLFGTVRAISAVRFHRLIRQWTVSDICLTNPRLVRR